MNVTVTPNKDLVYLGKPAPAHEPVQVTADIAELWAARGWLVGEKKAAHAPGSGGKSK